MSSTLEGTVGGHWMHERFVENLLAASHNRDLAQAAQEWELDKLDIAEHYIHCNLCNTNICHHVVISNSLNHNKLVIGEDCYDKLLNYLEKGQVRSSLQKRDDKTRSLRDYWKKKISDLDGTVVGWLIEEFNAKRLPADIAPIVYTIKRLGFAPTTDDADKLVSYYTSTRRFPRKLFISDSSLVWFRRRHWLPEMVTIDEANRIRDLISLDQRIIITLQRIKNEKEWRKRAAAIIGKAREEVRSLQIKVTEAYSLALKSGVFSELEVLAMLDDISRRLGEIFPEYHEYSSEAEVLKARNQAVHVLEESLVPAERAIGLWKQLYYDATQAIEWCRDLIAEAMKKGVPTAQKATVVFEELFREKISPLLPEELVATETEMRRHIEEALRLVQEWLTVYRWLLVSPQKIISVRGRKNYILVYRDGEWVRLEIGERYCMPGVISQTGVYTALVLTHRSSPKAAVMLLFHRAESSLSSILSLPFTNKREQIKQPWDKRTHYMRMPHYTAKHEGREVVSAHPFPERGHYRVYIERRGRHFRAWRLE